MRIIEWIVELEPHKEGKNTRIRISLSRAQGSPLFLQLIRYYGSVTELYTLRDTLMYLRTSMLRVELTELPSEIEDDGLIKDLSYDRDWYNGLQFSNEFSSLSSRPGIYSDRRLVKTAYNLSDPRHGDMRVYFSREEQADGYEREEVEGSLEPPFLMLPHIP
ncbi:MAG: hypothetical protein RXR06_11285 [Thermoproteus sp.]